jgi:WD40 repeat protein
VLFDVSAKKALAKVQHTDAVSCLTFDQNGLQLFVGYHDGSLQTVDLRSLDRGTAHISGVVENAHQLKFNEGVLSVAAHAFKPLLVSSGADCLIKVYEIS